MAQPASRDVATRRQRSRAGSDRSRRSTGRTPGSAAASARTRGRRGRAGVVVEPDELRVRPRPDRSGGSRSSRGRWSTARGRSGTDRSGPGRGRRTTPPPAQPRPATSSTGPGADAGPRTDCGRAGTHRWLRSAVVDVLFADDVRRACRRRSVSAASRRVYPRRRRPWPAEGRGRPRGRPRGRDGRAEWEDFLTDEGEHRVAGQHGLVDVVARRDAHGAGHPRLERLGGVHEREQLPRELRVRPSPG